jgi:hypothetical protein
MKHQPEKKAKKKPVSKSGKSSREHPFETMSQAQNRYGKGRQRSGSDGTGNQGQFSNH